MSNRSRPLVTVSLALLIVAALIIAVSSIPIASVRRGTTQRVYTNISDTPHRRVGLLLGTSKYTRSGAINRYYYARLRATADLYTHGRIDTVLASGDNQSAAYNEPQQMLDTLLALGVARDDIILDYAGLRTFDSVVRTGAVFGINEYIIITQHPHSLRALYIADQFDHHAIVYNALLPNDRSRMHFHTREMLARIKALLDIHILGTTPRHLGSAEQPTP